MLSVNQQIYQIFQTILKLLYCNFQNLRTQQYIQNPSYVKRRTASKQVHSNKSTTSVIQFIFQPTSIATTLFFFPNQKLNLETRKVTWYRYIYKTHVTCLENNACLLARATFVIRLVKRSRPQAIHIRERKKKKSGYTFGSSDPDSSTSRHIAKNRLLLSLSHIFVRLFGRK